MRTLDVFRDGQLVGHLRDTDDETEFEYASQYLAGQAQPISASLPLNPPLIRGPRARAFFGNLLPEGDVRTALSRIYKLDAADDVGLLGKLGADCAGALVILPSGERPLADDAPFSERYVVIEDDYELGQLIDALSASPTAIFKGVPTRMSLAGAQSKTALARFASARLYRSKGGATTHIVKFGGQLDQRGSEIFPGLIFNELFCSKLADACGISIRRTDLLPYRTYRGGPVEYVFCIERYDRFVHIHEAPGVPLHRVDRLHQEDFCQALGRSRTQKYEAQDGVSLKDMFQFCSNPDQIAVPAVARKSLLGLVLFNLLIGNRDSHAKNYSLIRSGFKAELAPAYDLVCTEIYENVDRSLPQLIGGADKPDSIGAEQLARLADDIALPPAALRREMKRLTTSVAKNSEKIASQMRAEPYGDRAAGIVTNIQACITANAERLARCL